MFRFLPKSWVLHREYVKLELLYVEQLRKRSEVLGGGGGQDDGDEDVKDSVTDCSVVRLVVNNAVESINDPKFVVSLISTLRIFEFANAITSELFQVLEDKYPTSPLTWDTLAREKLADGIAPCVEKYFQGLELHQSEELFKLSFSTLTDLADLYPRSPVRILKSILRLLRFGKEHNLLGVEHYKFWLELLDDAEERRELVRRGLSHHPQSVCLWTEELLLASSLPSSLRRALKAVQAEERSEVWRVALRLSDPASGWRLLGEEAGLLDRGSPQLRLLHLDQAAGRGVKEAWAVYGGYKDLPPYSAALHYRMVQLEEAEQTVDTARVREILALLCQQLGDQEPRAWLEAAKLEIRAGKPLQAANILARGELEVTQSLRQSFAVMREEMGLVQT